MKKIFFITLLLTCSVINAQNALKENKIMSNYINDLSFSVDNVEELNQINWNDIKEIFSENDTEQLISLSFKVDFPSSKNKFKSSFKVKGRTKNIDSLIIIAKKGVKGLMKISKNHQTK